MQNSRNRPKICKLPHGPGKCGKKWENVGKSFGPFLTPFSVSFATSIGLQKSSWIVSGDIYTTCRSCETFLPKVSPNFVFHKVWVWFLSCAYGKFRCPASFLRQVAFSYTTPPCVFVWIPVSLIIALTPSLISTWLCVVPPSNLSLFLCIWRCPRREGRQSLPFFRYRKYLISGSFLPSWSSKKVISLWFKASSTWKTSIAPFLPL